MKIVIGVDGSEPSRTACELVASRSWPAGTIARLVAAIEPSPWSGLTAAERGTDARRAELERVLDDHAELLRRAGIPCELVVEIGHAPDVLLAHADAWFADLIVVGNRGRGPAATAVLGSVSAHLVDHAPCPVLVARAPRVERMLFATDGSRSCLGVPRLLARWRPAFHGLAVEVLSISPDASLDEHRSIAAQVADEMVELGWRASAVARAGDPAAEIVHAAEGYGADLVVTGSRGLGTLGRLLSGSVAHAVLVRSHTSMLVVRGHVPAPTREAAAVLTTAGA